MTLPLPPPTAWSRARAFAISYGPLLIAVAYLAPRIVDAHFGLLDDAVTLVNAPRVVEQPTLSLFVHQAHGRMLAGYWLFWSFWYALGGASPAALYLSQLVLLPACLALMMIILRRLGASTVAIWIATLMFLFSAPVAEAFFTLSKAEPFALFLLLLSMALLTATNRSLARTRWVLVALVACAAVASRETAIAMCGVIAAWLVVSFVRALPVVPVPRRDLAMHLAAFVAGCVPVVVSIWWLRRSMPEEAYASSYRLDLATLAQGVSLRAGEVINEWPVILLLLPAAAWLVTKKRTSTGGAMLMMLVWAAGALAIQVPWRDYHPYYLLNFAAAISMFFGLLGGELLIAGAELAWPRRVLLASAVLVGVSFVNNFTLSRYQVMVDRANWNLVEYLAALPKNSVILVNMPMTFEYVYEIGLHLDVFFQRPDLRLEPMNFAPVDRGDGRQQRVVITPVLRHGRTPAVRGVLPEAMLNHWESTLVGSRRAPVAPIADLTERFQLADFSLDLLWCRAKARLHFAASDCSGPLVDVGVTTYGWHVYDFDDRASPPLVASFDRGIWTIEAVTAPPQAVAFGGDGDLPLAADWDGDSVLDLTLFRPALQRWFVDVTKDGRADREFELPGMTATDLPVAGDWTGGGHALPGYYRPLDGTWHLFTSADSGLAALPPIEFGNPTAIPLAGDWDGDGRATPALYQPEHGAISVLNQLNLPLTPATFSLPVGTPVVARWNGVAVDTVNVVREGVWSRQVANCNCALANDLPVFSPKVPPGAYFVGRWHEPGLAINR